MTKIDIFSGFLGAGKTTLIKKLISEAFAGEKLVLIENEFGEIGIDGGFLQDAGIEITEMNSGCICCSLVGDFDAALKQVLERFSPDRILIEPSGVGKLSDVIKAVSGVLCDSVVLNSATAVVDAVKCKMYMKNFGEFFNNQIENAGCIVLSRTDLTDEQKISDVVELIKAKNEIATIITTPVSSLTGKDILNAMEKTETIDSLKAELAENEEVCPCCGHKHEDGHHHKHDDHCCEHEHHNHHHEHDHDCSCHEHDHHHEHHHEHHHDCDCGCHEHNHEHHHHHADDVFASWGKETSKIYSSEQISAALNELQNEDKFGTVLRAKGYVNGGNEWIYFDYVPGEAEVRTGSAAVTGRICVIGANLNEAELIKLFEEN